MKELELTSNAALTDAVYETALNGSFLEVKLVAGSVGDDEPRGMQPEYECYHISYPDKKDTILFEQLLYVLWLCGFRLLSVSCGNSLLWI